MDESRTRIYKFGPFELDLEQRLLLNAGDLVPLTPKAFDTLLVLVARSGKVVDKSELIKLVWPDTFVEENNLTQNISALRKALGAGDFIETVPRRGYRFLIEIETISAPEPGPAWVPSDVAPAPVEIRKPRLGRPALWSWIALALVVMVILVAFVSGRHPGAGQNSNRVDSLVVLPFVNLTADPETEYFSDGLTEELTNAIAHLDGVRVVARTTAFHFKGTALDIRSIARQLNVGAVLEGSVRRQDKHLRVTVQLNDARSGYHIWSQTYDRGEGDILDIQEDISNQVARTIRPGTTIVRPGSQDREAHNAYLLGRFYRRRPDRESINKAAAFFQQAIDKDPKYAAAYAGLAECYLLLAQENAMSPVEAQARAREAVRKALEQDDKLAEAHTTLATMSLLLDRDWPAAEREFRLAIALNPNDAAAHHWFSHYLVVMGRFPESLAESRSALDLDPLDVLISAHLIWHYIYAGDFQSAIKSGLKTLELEPNAELPQLFLNWAYEDLSEWDKAIDALQLSNKVHPDPSLLRAALKADGPPGYWRARLAFLAAQKNTENYFLAVYHARLGEADKALDCLTLSLRLQEPNLIYLKGEPAFSGMRGNPRFKALTAAMKLP